MMRILNLLNGWAAEPDSEADVNALIGTLVSHKAYAVRHRADKSLLDHLIGTRNILRAWKQPPYVQAAALFHSVYSTSSFRYALIPVSQRVGLRKLIGTRAEALVHLFCFVDRDAFLARAAHPIYWKVSVKVRSDTRLSAHLYASPKQVKELLILLAANCIDQRARSDGGPGRHLAYLTQIAAVLAEVPDAFSSLVRHPMSEHDEEQLLEAYDGAISTIAVDPEMADELLSRCIRIAPFIQELWIWRAVASFRSKNPKKGVPLAEHALLLGDNVSEAWDTRLTAAEWTRVAELLSVNSAVTFSQLSESLIDGPQSLHELLPSRGQLRNSSLHDSSTLAYDNRPSAYDPAASRLSEYLNLFKNSSTDPLKRVYPGLRRRAWHDVKRFSIAVELEQAFEDIRREISALRSDEFHRESEPIERSGNWDVLFLYERGKRNDDVCKRLPTLSAIIDRYAIKGLAGLSYLSRLKPHTAIASHCGPTNLRLRCHLGLQVPTGDCSLEVDGQIEQWREGRCLVFDDFLPHSAWNNTDAERLVAIVDIWHPDLTESEIQFLEGLHTFASSYARNLQRYWSSNERSRLMH